MAKNERRPLPSEERLMRLFGVKTLDDLERELNQPDLPLPEGWETLDHQYELNERLEKQAEDLADLRLLSRVSPPPE